MVGVQLTKPFPDTVENNPSAICTLSGPKQGEYDTNDLDCPVMCRGGKRIGSVINGLGHKRVGSENGQPKLDIFIK